MYLQRRLNLWGNLINRERNDYDDDHDDDEAEEEDENQYDGYDDEDDWYLLKKLYFSLQENLTETQLEYVKSLNMSRKWSKSQ